MIFVLSNLLFIGCRPQESDFIDTGSFDKGASIGLELAWDDYGDAPWPVGAAHQLSIDEAYLAFGGVQFIPCLDSTVDDFSFEELTFELSITENLKIRELQEIGPFNLPAVAICELYFWQVAAQSPPEDWPQALGVENVFALSGQWGDGLEASHSVQLASTELRGKRIRFQQRLELDDAQHAVLQLFRDRQFMLDVDLMHLNDGTAFLEAIVRETQVRFIEVQ